MVAFVAFATFSMMEKSHHFTAEVAFVSLSIFNNLRSLCRLLPSGITSLTQCVVSLDRIDKFLKSRELPGAFKAADSLVKDSSPNALVLSNCSFTRGGSGDNSCGIQQPCLENLECTVVKGELIGVIGHMGCGKSTLIEAIAGEHHKIQGRIDVAAGKVCVSPRNFAMIHTQIRFLCTVFEGYPCS